MRPSHVIRAVTVTLILSLAATLPLGVIQANLEGTEYPLESGPETGISVYATDIDGPAVAALQLDASVNGWDALSADTREAILGQLRIAEYRPMPLGAEYPGSYTALNRAHALSLTFDADGAAIRPLGSEIFGPVSASSSNLSCPEFERLAKTNSNGSAAGSSKSIRIAE